MSHGSAAAIGRPRDWAHGERVDATVAIGLIVVVAAVLRFVLLAHNSLWDDETFVVSMIRHSWYDMVSRLAADDAHPPLYYLFMKAWTSVAGMSEVALRFPSAAFAAVSVIFTFTLARRVLQEQGARLAAIIMAVAPFQVMAAQEARMYSLLGMLVLGSTLVLAAALEHDSVARWAVYTISAAALAYTQYAGFLVLVSHGVWVITASERRQGWRWLAAIAGAALLFVPWLPSLMAQAHHTHEVVRETGGVTLHLGAMLGLIAFGGSVLGMPGYWTRGTLSVPGQVLVVLPFFVVACLGAAPMKRRHAFVFLIPLCVIAAAMGSAALLPAMYARVFSFLVPFYAILAAGGVMEIARRFRSRDLAAILIAIGLLAPGTVVLTRYYSEPGFRPYRWRAAADVVKQQVQSGDFFVYVGTSAEQAFTYYFREPHPSRTWHAEAGTPAEPPFTLDDARQIAHRYRRAWVVTVYPPTARARAVRQQVLLAMRAAFRTARAGEFNGVAVYLFLR